MQLHQLTTANAGRWDCLRTRAKMTPAAGSTLLDGINSNGVIVHHFLPESSVPVLLYVFNNGKLIDIQGFSNAIVEVIKSTSLAQI